MPKPFTGVIDLDVRDSTPDWTPFEQPKAPDGAPNVMFIVYDDTGFGAWEPFGGPIEMPTLSGCVRAACGTPSSTPPRSARRPGRRC